MRIALWNGSGLNNDGDRLLDRVNRVELSKRLPAAQFETFCPWNDASDSRSLWVDSDGHWSGEGAFEAIVIGGGGLLMGPPFLHPGMQSFFLGPHPERFRDDCFVSWNAVCSGSQFVAPLKTSWKDYVQAATTRIDLVSVRNVRTREFLMQCDVPEDPTVVPDPVVLIRPPRAKQSRIARRQRIGFAVARPVFPHAFLRTMGESAAARTVLSNPAVVQRPSAPRRDDYDERLYVRQLGAIVETMAKDHEIEIAIIPNIYGDETPATLLASMLESSSTTTTIEVDRDCRHLVAWIESLDCLVASRLHYCVVALAVGTPVVALDPYYSSVLGTSKLGQFMATGQGSDCWVPLAAALSGETAVSHVVQRAISLKNVLADTHARLWEAAAAHFDRLAECIHSGRRHRD